MTVNDSAYLGKGVKVGQHSIIKENARIGNDVVIFPHVYIGENSQIGDGTIVQYGAFIEHDCKIGKSSRIGTNTVLRRETNIGDNSIFGSLSASEGKNWIGNNVLIHSQCHLTTGIIVEDWVFIAPLFVGANDPMMLHGRRRIEKFVPKGPHIKFGSGIAVNVSLLPGVVIGRECIIGASSLVTKDIPDFSIAFGVPARPVKNVEDRWRLQEERYHEFRKRVSEEELAKIMEKILSDYN
ncbi:MAG: N-acetyltransferase [Candidatus Bathyarchaeota archaeon]|nr:MAG: N-acetyltransferase [Candidatus Bathyarchaeota archaeon]